MPPIGEGFWTQATPVGVLLFILILLFWAVITGRLRSNVAVTEIRADRDARIAEYAKQAADWKTAYDNSEKAREIQTLIAKDALEVSRTTEHVVNSLTVALDMFRKDGG